MGKALYSNLPYMESTNVWRYHSTKGPQEALKASNANFNYNLNWVQLENLTK